MPAPSVDALTSATLKDLRERWWNDGFTDFLHEMLRPRPGNRILDVGCGSGKAELMIGRLQLSQIRLIGIDVRVENVTAARRATASHNQRVGFAAADARRLPFRDNVFDSTYCVAVLQHLSEIDGAVSEFARVTVKGGRIVVVEPDNSARYSYSSVPAGGRAFELASLFFSAIAAAREPTDAAPGPKVSAMFAAHGIEPMDVRLFPVFHVYMGPPSPAVWSARRARVEHVIAQAPGEVASSGRDYLAALGTYETEAAKAAGSFVEIQNTMLFATVGQKGH